MADKKGGAQSVRDTRTRYSAAALVVLKGAAPRKGRGKLLSDFACGVSACCLLTSRPEKRLLAVSGASFFIARNEGSSMVSDNYACIHRIKYTHRKGKLEKDPQTRAMLSFRFRAMYRNLGLSLSDVAKLLRVSERTLHNWQTGRHEIPYSAYKLLRLLTHQELPGGTWAGWHITAGVLWSPEGHAFKAKDSSWWSMLCRRSEMFHFLYQENSSLKRNAEPVCSAKASESAVAQNMGAAVPIEGEASGVPVTRHFSLMDETFTRFQHVQSFCDWVSIYQRHEFADLRKINDGAFIRVEQVNPCPADARYARVSYSFKFSNGGV